MRAGQAAAVGSMKHLRDMCIPEDAGVKPAVAAGFTPAQPRQHHRYGLVNVDMGVIAPERKWVIASVKCYTDPAQGTALGPEEATPD
ncbi:MAG: hypothetical protein Q8R28_02815 [Dehalococcoidia bacterium]|nr:hypothetical protein [Dehalococcoidia bacterium]